MKIKIAKSDIIYIDMDGVLVESNETKSEFQAKRLEEGFFLKKSAVPGAIDSFNFISKNCNVYILSTPVWDNIYCWSEKRIWVQENLGDLARKKLILTHDKSLNLGKLLIDDSTNHGAGKFSGTHILFGSEEFPTWKEVLDSIIFTK